MNWQRFQQHPATFLVLSVLSVFGVTFAIWSHIANQPVRQISYTVETELFVDLDRNPGVGIEVQNERIETGRVYTVQLSLWNSGNQEITHSHFLNPLKFNTDLKWDEHSVIYSGTDRSQLIGDLVQGLKFNSLFPKSGIRVVFLSKAKPLTETIVGNINGGSVENSGVQNNSKYLQYWGRGILYFSGFMWLSLGYLIYKRADNPTPLGKAAVGLMMGFVFCTLPFLLLVLLSRWFLNPPF